VLESLSGDGVERLGRLANTLGNHAENHVDSDGEKGGQHSGEKRVHSAALVDVNEVRDNPPGNIHPSDGGSKAKAGNKGVEGLVFKGSD